LKKKKEGGISIQEKALGGGKKRGGTKCEKRSLGGGDISYLDKETITDGTKGVQ